jgi:hypothetical protein
MEEDGNIENVQAFCVVPFYNPSLRAVPSIAYRVLQPKDEVLADGDPGLVDLPRSDVVDVGEVADMDEELLSGGVCGVVGEGDDVEAEWRIKTGEGDGASGA